jgi:hypothetical protein
MVNFTAVRVDQVLTRPKTRRADCYLCERMRFSQRIDADLVDGEQGRLPRCLLAP